MSDARLQIVIDTLNKASGDLKKLRGDIDGVDESAKKADSSTEGFGGKLKSLMGTATAVAAGVAAVGIALKKVYDVGREGAELLYVEDRFNNLTEAIGTTSDALMGDLREATRGLKSDSELMSGALDFMQLGLAKSHDEVVRLTSVAGALGMNMNQLVLTLTNRTTMRFDALGISVDGFDEKVKALEASGLSVQDAFTEAFLQQAEDQIGKVGHAADSTKGAFDRLGAGVKTNMDNMKKDTAKAIEPIIGYLADLVEGNNSYKRVKERLDEMYESGLITNQMWADMKYQLDYTAIGQEGVNKWIDDYIVKAKDQATAAADTAAAYYDYVGAVDDATDSTIELGEEMVNLAGVTLDADLAMQSYTEKLLFKIASEGLGTDEALELAKAMGMVDESTMFAARQMDVLRQRYDDGLISADQYRAAVVALGGEIGRLEDKTVTVNVKLNDPQNVKGWNLRDQTATYTVNTKVTGDAIPQQRASGGPVSAGNPYLWQEYGYRGEMFVPSQSGYILSRSDAKRIVSEAVGGSQSSKGAVYNYYLNMPTSNNPMDILMAFDLMKSYGA